jgi:hypothetical protein
VAVLAPPLAAWRSRWPGLHDRALNRSTTSTRTGASHASQVRKVNGTLLFVADDGTHGFEVWKGNL